ncbi:MAG: hypothetical protein JW966_14245 [Anaerolineae bacterium]|nr:hypothetical protein [Anaerolineae bacterium]
MPQVNVFRWRTGSGWLVLSGGGTWASDDVVSIESKVLSYTLSQGPVAYIWAAGDIEAADRHMDALRDLGARTGFLIDIVTEDDDTLFEQLSEAGVIILGDGPHQETLRDALLGVVLRSMEQAFDRGATLYAVGRSAAVMGAQLATGSQALTGCDWLADAIILPQYTTGQADTLRDQVYHYGRVHRNAGGYGLGLGEGAALALGPRGEVEAWGSRAITISLGQGYGPDLEET